MSDKRTPLARSSLAGDTQGEGGMRDLTASCEVWILAANRMMARALEVERCAETFAAHGVTLAPRLVSELRLLAGKDGLSLCDAAGDPIAPPRLCICRVYEPHAPRHLEIGRAHV